MTRWFVYLLRCSDYSPYCGTTKDLDRRVQEHNEGIGSRYTRSRLPIQLAWSSPPLSKSAAYKQEYRIKRLSKDSKETLVEGVLGEESAKSIP